jgi:hypothetical protein
MNVTVISSGIEVKPYRDLEVSSYIFHEDAGHGWLEVPIADVKKLGIYDKITAYSYIKGDKLYIEEDCDASTFCRAFEQYTGHKMSRAIIKDDYCDVSPIRNYRHFVSKSNSAQTVIVDRIVSPDRRKEA